MTKEALSVVDTLKLALDEIKRVKEIWLVESPTAFWFSHEPVHDLPDDCVVTHMVPAQPAVAEQHKQEPVEWYSVEGETRRYGVGMVECAYVIGRDEVVHVVTHESVKDVAMKHLPTQRTWVGLTDEQIVPMFRAREKMKVLGEKDAWFWYAWGIGDAEAAHGITKE